MRIAKQFNISQFIGKSRSPSCGCRQIYDGTSSGRMINVNGVTTTLLKRNKNKVNTEGDLWMSTSG